jgi:hypothetical protein
MGCSFEGGCITMANGVPGESVGHVPCPDLLPAQHRPASTQAPGAKETMMGKYFLGWLLGVPTVVLVVLWFFFR